MVNPVVLSVDDLSVFCDSYIQARASFLAYATTSLLVTAHETYELKSSVGSSDELLTTEVLWLGSSKAKQVLVLISATHGVEGFTGAAVQNDFLKKICERGSLPQGMAVLLIFALNPYGFLNCRRCDSEGIDLNRNFVDFTKPLPSNSGYSQIISAIYEKDNRKRKQQFAGHQHIYGQVGFEMAISAGQYSDPQGPFFGGTGPAHGRDVIEKVIEKFDLANRHLAVIDIHTGLGPYGHGEIINDHPQGSSGFFLAQAFYGGSVTSPALGDSSSVPKLGLLDYAWHSIMQEQGCFVTLEFGSFGTEALFEVILNDHLAWALNDQVAKTASAIAMKEHFFPNDVYWRELILIKSRQVIALAMRGFQSIKAEG